MSNKMTSKTSNKQNTTINEDLIKKLKEPETIISTSTTMTTTNEQKEIPNEMPYTYDAILNTTGSGEKERRNYRF